MKNQHLIIPSIVGIIVVVLGVLVINTIFDEFEIDNQCRETCRDKGMYTEETEQEYCKCIGASGEIQITPHKDVK